MNLIVKIIISVAVAAAAAVVTTLLTGSSHAVLLTFFAFCGATVTTALLVSLPIRSATPAPTQQQTSKAKHTPKPAARSVARATTAPAVEGTREFGQVKWFNVSKGFGFITKDDGEEIFVHFRSIRGAGRRGLQDGQRVSFVVAESDKGPQAEDVEGID